MGQGTSLQQRIQDWITEEVGTEAASEFADAFADQLRPDGERVPLTDGQWASMKEEAKRSGFTPTFIQNCVNEYRRAEEKGWTLRQWMEDAFGRVLPEEQARQRVEVVRQIAEQMESANKMSDPVQPEDILGYRLMLNKIAGGSAGLLALQQGQQQNRFSLN
jgi:hypothetical protein